MVGVFVTCPQPPALAVPRPDRPRYAVDVRVAPPFTTVSGRLSVTFTPSRPVRRVVFRLWPGTRLQVSGVHATRPDPTTLVVPKRLAPGSHVTIAMNWRLTLPRGHLDRIARFGDGVRLGTFFPLLAWDP